MTDSNDRLDRVDQTITRLESLMERMGDRATLRNRLDRLEEISSDNAVQIGKLARHVERVAESVEQFSQVYDRDRRTFRDMVANHDRIINRQDEIIKLLTREIVGSPTATAAPLD